jgi:CRP/FNR family transcriptional regulator, transcriptional activator FtrB
MRPGATTLREVPVFATLNDALLAELDAIASVVTARHGDQLCQQGTMPKTLYFILEGRVALSSTAPDGSTAVVEVLRPAEDFVLATVMSSHPYIVSAHVVQHARLLAIDVVGLRALVEREPALALALLRDLSQSFRSLVRQIRDLKVRTTPQRLGCYLLALIGDPQAPTAEFRLPFEKGLLAALLGCRQENLSRAFAALREIGVETRGSHVILRDIPRLTAYSMPDYLTDPELSQPVVSARENHRVSDPVSA